MDFNRPIYIVAGGPSLRGFDFSRLADKQVIGINRACEVLHKPLMLWWTDVTFFETGKERIIAAQAQQYHAAACDNPKYKYPDWVTKWKLKGMRGYCDEPETICHGNNSGYAALHVVAKLGFKKVGLLGYDFYIENGHDHWHHGYFAPLKEYTLKEKMLPFFGDLVHPLRELGVTVLNGNVNSALTHWQRVPLEDMLNEDHSCWRS